ncbi:hypothetical protein [Streptomyces sp. SID13031]|uniref:hypothetical protein n=1 Tax=Streptomyces sp. SID13031 TaxID=2706046 RepID=UPI0019457233|nr:hypothetical protein [Streptomyces sp. SID13031]
MAAVGGVVVAEKSSAADLYGSGQLTDWTTLSREISSAATIAYARDNDGVYMFGDSIAVQDGRELTIRLKARTGSPLAMHNWSGRPTLFAVDALENWALKYRLPRRILMATGTNDIFNPPVLAAQVDRTMRIAGPTRTVVWVNTQVARTGQPVPVQVADQRNSGWVNLQLYDAQKKYPNLRIVGWAEYLAAKPSLLPQCLSEGVHTTVPFGQNARNELIVQGLATANAA